MGKKGELSSRQKSMLHYIGKYETEEFGAIVGTVTALALIEKGYCVKALRRKFARFEGTSVRLTDKGKAYVNGN